MKKTAILKSIKVLNVLMAGKKTCIQIKRSDKES